MALTEPEMHSAESGDRGVHGMEIHLTNEARGALLQSIISPQELKHGETIRGTMPDGKEWRIQYFEQNTGDADRGTTWHSIEVGATDVIQIICLHGGLITSARSIKRNAKGVEQSNVHEGDADLDALIELIAQSQQGVAESNEEPFDMTEVRGWMRSTFELQQ